MVAVVGTTAWWQHTHISVLARAPTKLQGLNISHARLTISLSTYAYAHFCVKRTCTILELLFQNKRRKKKKRNHMMVLMGITYWWCRWILRDNMMSITFLFAWRHPFSRSYVTIFVEFFRKSCLVPLDAFYLLTTVGLYHLIEGCSSFFFLEDNMN